MVFSLRAIIDGIESASDEVSYFANTETGEVDCYMDSLYGGFDDDYDDDCFDAPEWVALPEHDTHEDWRVMRDFAFALGGPEGDELLDAIQGRGAFRAFRNQVEKFGILQSWYAYKDMRNFEIATEWLDARGLAWADDRHESRKRDWRALLPEGMRAKLVLDVLVQPMTVCKVAEEPAVLPAGELCFFARTADELSLVCETAHVPAATTAREDGWRALKVAGPLDFGLVGILAKITQALAEAQVPVFAVSTYDTDYVLVKEDKLETTVDALRYARCEVNA